MSFGSKYKKGSKFDVNTEGFTYENLKDLFKKNGADFKYKLLGIYINKKGKFNDAPVAICEGYFVNLPAHTLVDVINMLVDDDDVDAIKQGFAGFVIEEYQHDKYGTCYGINWVDL